ncbi:MAG: hypothetical protein SGJ09_09165 [Phycisphaerae bacterium]|nr:hypothetical protein [Phycisphaerae bacterium]
MAIDFLLAMTTDMLWFMIGEVAPCLRISPVTRESSPTLPGRLTGERLPLPIQAEK